jgi:predicted RND superfamily exporter protein
MEKFMKGFSRFVYKFRAAIIAVTVLLTIFFGYELVTKITINSDVISYLPKTDQAVALFNSIGDDFGSNEVGLIALKADDVFAPGVVKHVDEITKAIKSMPGVASVTSMTDVMDIKGGADGSIEISKLIDLDQNPDYNAAVMEKTRAYALSKETYRGRIISADSKATLIACFLSKDIENSLTAKKIKETVEGLKTGEKLYYGGTPFLTKSLADLMLDDLKILVPIVIVLIVITLFLSFGTVRGVLIPITTVFISNIWVIGFMALCRVPLTVISNVIPVLLVAIGTAPSIHILSKFDEDPEKRYGSTGDEAVNAFSEVGTRVVLTSLTIIFGFAAFIFGSYLTMVRDFGLFMSIGVFITLLTSVIFIPAVLSYVKIGRDKKVIKRSGPSPADRMLEAIGKFVISNRVLVLVISFGLAVVGIVGIPFIQRGFDILDFVKPTHEIRIADNVISDNFGGTKPIQVVFSGDIQEPAVLSEVRRTDKFLESLKDVSNSQSVALFVSEMEDIMEGGRRVPDSKIKISNLWFLLEGQDMLARTANSDNTKAMVQAVSRSTKDPDALLRNIETYLTNMDKEFYLYDRKKSSKEAAAAVNRYLTENAADLARMDLLKRDKTLTVTNDQISAIIEKDMVSGKIDAKKTAAEIQALLPADKADQFIAQDIKDDLLAVNDQNTWLPARVYNTLPGDKAKDVEPVKFSVEYTGLPLIYKHLDNSLLSSQVQSFMYALAFIYIIFVLQLKSFRFGFVGLVPIVLTVCIMFGIMGFCKIPLDVATVLTGSIAMGIGIDYAIHFSVRFKSFFLGGDSPADAVMNTLRTTGKAIVINVAAVTAGFVTLLFARMVPMQRFAVLIAVAMIGSGMGALTTLPALLLKSNPKFLGKLEKRREK